MTSKLLIDEYPLMVLPKLATAIGLNEAIVLQQIHYWVETFKKTKDDHHYQDGQWWVWNTIEEWRENFPFWSTATINRVMSSLRSSKLVITGNHNSKKYDRTLWYRINYDSLNAILSDCESPFTQNDKMDHVKMSEPIPETNTETISEKTNATSVAVSPEQSSKDDLQLFFGGNVPETPTQQEPTEPLKLDVLTHTVEQAGRRDNGEVDWLLPGTACGDHAYLEPLRVFCAVIRREPATLGQKVALQWLRKLEHIGTKEAIRVTPPLMVDTIKAMRGDWAFVNDVWLSPYAEKFGEKVRTVADRITSGEMEASRTLEMKGRYQ